MSITIHKAAFKAKTDSDRADDYKPIRDAVLSPYVAPGLPKTEIVRTVGNCGLKGHHLKTVKSKI